MFFFSLSNRQAVVPTFAQGLISRDVSAVEMSSATVIALKTNERVAFGTIVNDAGGVGGEDRAPGVEEVHVAADRAEGRHGETDPLEISEIPPAKRLSVKKF
jgi:hypothetical protein